MRLPDISQPLVTALQLALLALFEAAGLSPISVAGHSSGEIAAAVAADYLTPEQDIKIAYYRRKATTAATYTTPLGMVASGLEQDTVEPFLAGTYIQIACINSSQGVALSGVKSKLFEIENKLKKAASFVRLLVDAAYHSKHMLPVGKEYRKFLDEHVEWEKLPSRRQKQAIVMFSFTTGEEVKGNIGPAYWVQKIVSPVLFQAPPSDDLLTQQDAIAYWRSAQAVHSPDRLIK